MFSVCFVKSAKLVMWLSMVAWHAFNWVSSRPWQSLSWYIWTIFGSLARKILIFFFSLVLKKHKWVSVHLNSMFHVCTELQLTSLNRLIHRWIDQMYLFEFYMWMTHLVFFVPIRVQKAVSCYSYPNWSNSKLFCESASCNEP